MTTVNELTQEIKDWTELAGYDFDKIKEALKGNPTQFFIEKAESDEEAEIEGLDMSYPFRLFNPHNFDVAQD